MNITPRSFLGAARIGVGALSLMSPAVAARAFGIDPGRSDAWVTRLFGSRELVLAGSLLAAKGPQVRTVALLGAAIDGLDVISSAAEMSRGNLTRYTGISGGGGAVLFLTLGLLAAQEDQSSR